MQLSLDQATALCRMAALGAGAREEAADVIARAAVAAEAEGNQAVGLSHFLDYLSSLSAGRIDGSAEPVITRPALAVFLSDAQRGLPHVGFERALDDVAKAASLFGVAVFAQRNAYTCGALGWFTRRLAERGLVAIAATNGPALLAGSGSIKPVYCTNPLSFAATAPRLSSTRPRARPPLCPSGGLRKPARRFRRAGRWMPTAIRPPTLPRR
jgi:(2R)-3-sulfolactate dehydrogenase (NADP+)